MLTAKYHLTCGQQLIHWWALLISCLIKLLVLCRININKEYLMGSCDKNERSVCYQRTECFFVANLYEK